MTATATVEDPVQREERIRKNNEATPADGVMCELDGKWVHSISTHLKFNHPTVTLAEYRKNYPTAPIESERMKRLRAARGLEEGTTVAAAATVTPFPVPEGGKNIPLYEVLGAKPNPLFKNSAGRDIMCPVMGHPPDGLADFIPAIDENYVFQPDLVKTVLMGVVLKLPTLAWGYHGSGKTTLFEQFCARTNRPWIRVQHTVSTEESHIVGQYVVKMDEASGKAVTVFEPGPLAFAMRNGLVYCADEYDFALPSVTAVYQPVLEGKALVIKEAPPEWRVVKPHDNFRFFATGNTNGSGDETGLYQGTQIMNAANYSRFGITIKVEYMEPSIEAEVVKRQGNIHIEDARKLVEFGKHVRDAYANNVISVTVSRASLSMRPGWVMRRAAIGSSAWTWPISTVFPPPTARL